MGIKRYSKYIYTLILALTITCAAVIVDVMGIGFLVLKLVTMPFIPERNIDNMSDYYTAVWESVHKNETIDNERLTVIDITTNDRNQISEILVKVSKMNPAIIGLDVSFISEEDHIIDSALLSSILSIPNIILPLVYDKEEQKFYDDIFRYTLDPLKYGVVSFPGNSDILRTFQPSFYDGNTHYNAFGCCIAQEYGTDITYLKDKNNVLINYTTLKLTDKHALPGKSLLHLNSRDSVFLASQITNKIVLIGGTHDTRDYHLTPLGYGLPGIMIHAHIINSIIEGKIISSLPIVLRYVLCFILALITLLFARKRNQIKNNGNKVGKTLIYLFIVFLISQILFAFLGTVLFCKICYYIDFAPYIITLIFVYFFEAHKDFNPQTLCKRN